MKYIVGIDIGTTSLKAAVFDEELNCKKTITKDYTLDEIITAKKYANYVYERVLNPNGKKDIEHTVEVLVNVIEELPKGTEISISQILGNHFKDYETSELIKINQKVMAICSQKGISLNFDKYNDQKVGFPFNIPFIKE